MKRIVLVMVCLILVILPSVVMAGNCSCCSYDNGLLQCTNTKRVHYAGYVMADTYHEYYDYYYNACRNCGIRVPEPNTLPMILPLFQEAHTYSGDVCTKCKYNRITGETESVAKDYSYENSLQEDAYQMRDRLIGSIATVVNEGNIRQRPDKESERLGKAFVGDIYTILDYQVALSSRTSVWLKVQYGHAYGWLSASLVEISENDGSTPGGIVGSQVSITLTLGRTRRGAGTSYPKTGYVRQGEVYTVLDSKAASDGVLWYKIEKNGQYHWISSGITEKIR